MLFRFDGTGWQPGGAFNGALACDNVEQTYHQLVDRGVEFTSGPTKASWGTFATFEDPDGNQLALSSR